MRLLSRHTGAFGVGDAWIQRQGSALATLCDLGGAGGINRPGVKQVEVAHGGLAQGQIGRIRQTGGRVVGGEACDVVCCAHGLFERSAREVRGARIAAPLADVDRHADRLVAVALDVLDFTLAHRHRQANALGNLGAGIGGTDLCCELQRIIDQLLEIGTGIGKACGHG